jgi:pimeloyl-ACP methyl ester carboxylesterase
MMDISAPFVIVGLSFGCLIAIEIAKLYPDQIIRLILISGICTSHELPKRYRRLGFFGLQHTFLVRFLKRNKWVVGRLFGSKPNSDFSQYLFNRLKQVSVHYLKWSIHSILTWKQQTRLPVIRQIHGSKDSVFPLTTAQPEYVIKGAGHLMIRTHAHQVNEILKKIFQEIDAM